MPLRVLLLLAAEPAIPGEPGFSTREFVGLVLVGVLTAVLWFAFRALKLKAPREDETPPPPR